MVFALETYWPAADGWSAARIEEEVVVTADGCEVITKFPAEDLLIAGQRYWTVGGPAAGGPRVAVAPQHRPRGGASREHGHSHPVWTCATLLGWYEQMAVIRGTEKAAHDLFLRGLVKGTTHLAAGHEAVAVGGQRRAAARRLRLRHLPGPPPRHRPRSHPGGVPGRADAATDGGVPGQGRVDAPDPGGPRDARLVRDRRRAPAHGRRRRVVGAAARQQARSRWPSSATAPRTSARSTRRSTSPRSGSCRWCSSARTTATWSTPRSTP